jgi:hypothetical protein
MNLNGLTFAIALSNSPAAPNFKDETGRRFLWGDRFAAEVRCRAAGDGSYLLPA